MKQEIEKIGINDQVSALRRQVKRTREWLQDLESPDQASAQRLKDIMHQLLPVCGRREEDVNDLARRVSNSRASLRDEWETLAIIDRGVRALVADCAALESRITHRPSEHALSLCTIADRLVEEFSLLVGHPRSHYVLLSEAAHFGTDASVIHLSCARLEVWNLNRAAHEFGHLWAEECLAGMQNTFVNAISEHWESDSVAPSVSRPREVDSAKQFFKEFFADIVATFLMGPAYALSCLRLDFNPVRKGSDSHPSDDERAHCILATLAQLAEKYDLNTAPKMRWVTEWLEQFWSAARVAAGAGGPLAKSMPLGYDAGAAVNDLTKILPSANYKSLSRANSVNLALKKGLDIQSLGVSCTDVLNGAWFRRLDVPDEELTIGEKAIAMMNVRATL